MIQELRQFTDLPQPSREQKTKNPNPFTRFGFLFMNGREGIRTLGLRDANAALSQLSHSPGYVLRAAQLLHVLQGYVK